MPNRIQKTQQLIRLPTLTQPRTMRAVQASAGSGCVWTADMGWNVGRVTDARLMEIAEGAAIPFDGAGIEAPFEPGSERESKAIPH
jgi:hypothetical protein